MDSPSKRKKLKANEKAHKTRRGPTGPLHIILVLLQDPVLARFRVVRLVMQNQPYQSRLSGKNLIALFMKEQPV